MGSIGRKAAANRQQDKMNNGLESSGINHNVYVLEWSRYLHRGELVKTANWAVSADH